MTDPARASFLERLRSEGGRRYHDRHPFHVAMHEGKLRPEQLRHWVRNRYYYQSRIPLKDALILAKAEDTSFRRRWIRRIHEQDGSASGEGGLEAWLKLGEAVGLDRRELVVHRGVVRGVRFACDAYVELVARSSLLEAVASSLT
ncbi:MAG: pyrroloquinoline-quinone synthase PqqC, partial [Polyangiaceae bacterium]|nr:pyrroloquinoline-quinone synthase PqqC [Polyangiaceae bacterium]